MIITAKQMRPRDRFDFYPTPAAHIGAAFSLLPPDLAPASILDPGAGLGVWGMAARLCWPSARIVGIEPNHGEPAPLSYDHWSASPFESAPLLQYLPPFDLVVGNPPYKYAESFVRLALDLLAPGGWCVFLLRLAFLESQTRARGLWKDAPPVAVGVYPVRPSFTGNGRTDATAYAAFAWRKGFAGDPVLRWVGV